jgi:hypothetical protein
MKTAELFERTYAKDEIGYDQEKLKFRSPNGTPTGS